jgi:hypothetical protein
VQLLDSAVCVCMPRSSHNFDSACRSLLRLGRAARWTRKLQFRFQERPSLREQLLPIGAWNEGGGLRVWWGQVVPGKLACVLGATQPGGAAVGCQHADLGWQ